MVAPPLVASDVLTPKQIEKYLVDHTELSGAEKQKFRAERLAAYKLYSGNRMRAAKFEMVAKQNAVKEKVKLGMPITDNERDLLDWSPTKKRAKTRAEREADLIAAASKVLIQPTHVKELRLMVERTAAKYAYNPIEELILLTKPVPPPPGSPEGTLPKHQVTADDRISIHKALLPFLVPVLQAPKPVAETPEGGGMKVVITQYTFPEAPATPIHEAKITKVDTTVEPATPPL